MKKKERQYPFKTSINLAQRERRPGNLAATVTTAVILAMAIAAFSKFGVIDRLQAVGAIRAQVAQQEALVEQVREQTAEYDLILERYQSESLRRNTAVGGADPIKCLELVEKNLLNRARVASFTVDMDTVTVKISDVTLNDISDIYQNLTKDAAVAGVQVFNASTDNENSAKVTAAMTISMAVEKPAQTDAGKGAAS